MTAPDIAQPVSVRLTSPQFAPEDAERVRKAAKAEGRSVSNFIARASLLAAQHILGPAEEPTTTEG